MKYWTNPDGKSKIFLSQIVAERNVATYLLRVQQNIYYESFWEQNICKSYSRYPSRSPGLSWWKAVWRYEPIFTTTHQLIRWGVETAAQLDGECWENGRHQFADWSTVHCGDILCQLAVMVVLCVPPWPIPNRQCPTKSKNTRHDCPCWDHNVICRRDVDMSISCDVWMNQGLQVQTIDI